MGACASTPEVADDSNWKQIPVKCEVPRSFSAAPRSNSLGISITPTKVLSGFDSDASLHSGGLQTPRTPSAATNGRGPRAFTWRELETATERFKAANCVGEGGFGKVYKGWMRGVKGDPTKTPVAVKRLKADNEAGHKEWLAEVLLLGNLSHPHLVLLIGHCSTSNGVALVYEFAAGGSLDAVLFPKEGQEVLGWATRVQIAYGSALGVAYLHSNRIIHRDLKVSNILLREDMTAMVTDFGLAKVGPNEGATHVSTNVKGSFGYLDPSYLVTGHLTFASDVFAFGVILLEIVTGRPAINEEAGGSPLLLWVTPKLLAPKLDLAILVDARLKNDYSKSSARKLLHIARRCLREEVDDRPTFEELVELMAPIYDAECQNAAAADDTKQVEGAVPDIDNAQEPADEEIADLT
eukprot:TRINITY_DN38424_c0_g1_i1.p1 TRINITY_DN38424_c0_g1~~TRINITY_DN38424_c0_g1_i1.p1  ORF type:complete len:409 (+),score=62.11 TRINITY_DN38424_c0_g1_i1:751-1977(+)